MTHIFNEKTEVVGKVDLESGVPQEAVFIVDEDVKSFLNQVLKELKVIRMHLEIITDNEISKEDIG